MIRKRAAAVPLVLVALALDALGVGLVVPVTPELVRQLSHQAPANAAGWVGASVITFAAAQFLAAPILGALSDRFGRRTVLLTSIGGFACNYLLLAWAPSLIWLFLGRAIAGGTAASSSAASAYIADVTPPAQRARRFGLIGAVFGGAFVVGPAVGGVLGGFGLRWPFLAAALLSALNFAFALLLLPESLSPDRRRRFDWRRANPVGSLGALFAIPGGVRLSFAWSVMWFAIGVLQTVFVLYTGFRLGWGPRDTGLALGMFGLTQVLVQTLAVTRVIRRLGTRRTAVLGLVADAVGYGLLAGANVGWIVFVAIGFQAFGSIANPSLRALLSTAMPEDRQGQLAGALSSVEGLTAIVAPLIAASLFSFFAAPQAMLFLPGAPFLAAAALFAAAAIVIASLDG